MSSESRHEPEAHAALEAELRERRPRVRHAFLSALAADVRSEVRRESVPRWPTAIALGLTVAMLGAMAAVGAPGYAASAVTAAAEAVGNVAKAEPKRKVPKRQNVVRTAAQAQYKVTICHRADERRWVQIRVSMSALPAHMAHGDFIVGPTAPCPPAP
jgi:hypothetical protein